MDDTGLENYRLDWLSKRRCCTVPPPSLGHHPTLGIVCKAAGPLGEPLHAIEKGALSGESSSLGAWLGI